MTANGHRPHGAAGGDGGTVRTGANARTDDAGGVGEA